MAGGRIRHKNVYSEYREFRYLKKRKSGGWFERTWKCPIMLAVAWPQHLGTKMRRKRSFFCFLFETEIADELCNNPLQELIAWI
jgi:hypothetical protein